MKKNIEEDRLTELKRERKREKERSGHKQRNELINENKHKQYKEEGTWHN